MGRARALPQVDQHVAVDLDGGVLPKNSILFYESLLTHGVPAEMHIYEVGGHGFGMFRDKRPADLWPNELAGWLKARKIID